MPLSLPKLRNYCNLQAGHMHVSKTLSLATGLSVTCSHQILCSGSMDSTQLNLAPVNLLSNVDMELVKGISTGLLAFIAYACFYRWVLHRNRRGPRIWPLLGTWLELNANKHHFYEWLQPYFDRFPTISIPSLSYHYVLSVDPANLEYVSKTNFNNYPKVSTTVTPVPHPAVAGRYYRLIMSYLFEVPFIAHIMPVSPKPAVARSEILVSAIRPFLQHWLCI